MLHSLGKEGEVPNNLFSRKLLPDQGISPI